MTIINPYFEPELSRRELEGPPRLLSEYEGIEVQKLHETAGKIGSVSLLETFRSQYGQRGIGWDTDNTRYQDYPVYDLDADQNLVELKLVDVLVYPDGDQYALEAEERNLRTNMRFGMPYMPYGEEE